MSKTTTNPNARAARILKSARNFLAADSANWTQRTMCAGGAYCAIGALNRASGLKEIINYPTADRNGTAREKATFFLANAITGRSKVCHDDIIRFNDFYATSHQAVIAAFDRAIELAAKNKTTRKPLEEVT